MNVKRNKISSLIKNHLQFRANIYYNILKKRDSKLLETHTGWNERASGLLSDGGYTGRIKLSHFFQLYKICLVKNVKWWYIVVAGNKRENVDCCQVTGYLFAFLKILELFLGIQKNFEEEK